MIANILYLSLQGTVAIFIVFIVTYILRWLRFPKRYSYLIWAIPLFRLICPLYYEWKWSIYPRRFIDFINHKTKVIADKADYLLILWGIGFIILIGYSIITYIQLKIKLAAKKHYQDNVFLADNIHIPLIVGIWKPMIYIPSHLSHESIEYVLVHEKIHLKRQDYTAKSIVFILACVHWFNPIVWFLFIRLQNDMEMSCDEETIRQLGENHREEYVGLLKELSAQGHKISSVPFALGERGTKERVKNIHSRHKDKGIALMVVAAIFIVLIIGLLTNPLHKAEVIHIDEQELDYITIKHTVHQSMIQDEADIKAIMNAINGTKIRRIGVIQRMIDNRDYLSAVICGSQLIGTKGGYIVKFYRANDNEPYDTITIYDEMVSYNGEYEILNNRELMDSIQWYFRKNSD